jgi:hypothetical protein
VVFFQTRLLCGSDLMRVNPVYMADVIEDGYFSRLVIVVALL